MKLPLAAGRCWGSGGVVSNERRKRCERRTVADRQKSGGTFPMPSPALKSGGDTSTRPPPTDAHDTDIYIYI